MRKTLILASTAIALAIFSAGVSAQSESGKRSEPEKESELEKVELGIHFTSITKPDFFGGGRSEAGFGGRFTFNFNRSVAIEAEGNFFPHNCLRCRNENVGTLAQGFFGVKAGKRFRKFGVFAKARPGFVSFSGGDFEVRVTPLPSGAFPFFEIFRSRATHFAGDVGGVVELYHSRRLFTRFDVSDTIISYPEHTSNGFSVDPGTGTVILFPVTRPADIRHHFQFSAGIGIRF